MDSYKPFTYDTPNVQSINPLQVQTKKVEVKDYNKGMEMISNMAKAAAEKKKKAKEEAAKVATAGA